VQIIKNVDNCAFVIAAFVAALRTAAVVDPLTVLNIIAVPDDPLTAAGLNIAAVNGRPPITAAAEDTVVG